MDIKNEFDTAIEARFRGPLPLIHDVTGRSSEELKAAAIFVTDTMDLAHKASLAIFGSKAKPEVSLEFYRLIIEQLKQMPPIVYENLQPNVKPAHITYEELVGKSDASKDSVADTPTTLVASSFNELI